MLISECGPHRILFTSFDCHEPPHVRVERDGRRCKVWLEPPRLALGSGADEFLGTQGDPRDTQSDLFTALLGALTALFARLQGRQVAALER